VNKNFLKKIRTQKGLTLQQLSVPAEVSPQAISNYENFRVNLGAKALQRVADALDVTVEQITTTGTNTQFNEKEQKILLEAMNLAHEANPNLNQKEVVELASKIFKIHLDYESSTSNKTEIAFENTLKSKSLEGIAAQTFIDQVIKKKHIQ